MRVLVTGSGGHVGSVIAARLTADGHEVIGLGRGAPGGGSSLAGSVVADIGHAGLAGQVTNDEPRCEAIVHAAAALDRDPLTPRISLTNCFGTHQLLELATRWNVASFIFISSVPVIGRPVELPITERHPVDPQTAYHASKLYGERLVAICGRAGLAALSLRLSAPVGPGMPDGRILSVFVRSALEGAPLEVAGRGARCQDYVDVRDVAAAVAAALERNATGLLNIGSGRSVSNLDLARRCVELLSSRSQVRLSGAPDPEDGVRWEVSIEAATRALEYRPQHSLDDSIDALAAELRVAADA